MAAVTAPLFASPSLHRPATLSVVIRIAHSDEWDDVDRALESLWRQTVQPDHVVVVVDHDDHLLEWAADAWSTPGTAGDMRVDVIANTRSPGHAGARDTAIQWAWGEIVAFLARDAVADPHWVETLLQDYADTDVAGVGGGALADWGTASPPSWLPAAFEWAADCAHPRLPGDPAIGGDFTAANLSFRREVLVEVGGFAAARGVDGLCRRVRERFPRARLRFDDDLEVFQRMDDDERTFAHFRRRCFAEGRADGARHRTGSAIDRGPGRAFTATSGTAVIEGLRDGVAGRRDGFRRAGAASAGLAFAAAGYVRGRLPFG
jgi:glycosyltransferase involved in cell wall biosynthesis